jgi:hypothetical protein
MAVNNDAYDRRTETICTAEILTELGIPVSFMLPGRKVPEAGRLTILSEPEQAASFVEEFGKRNGGANIVMRVGVSQKSPVVCVGLDPYKDVDIENTAKRLGIDRQGNVWAWQTGRGGTTVCYRAPSVILKHEIEPEGHGMDLLSNGGVILPPSETSRIKDEGYGAGGPYNWNLGHSPWDIHLDMLDEPPPALLEYWVGRNRTNQERTSPAIDNDWVGDALAHLHDGNRDVTFARLIGKLHAQGWPCESIITMLSPYAERCSFPHSRLVEETRGLIARYPAQPGSMGIRALYGGEGTLLWQ